MDTYKIVRHYQRASINRRTIMTGLTLQEAQAHCQDPNTSSRSCTTSVGRQRTKKLGPWFDGYEKE